WKDIRLEGYGAARLADVHLRQRHENGAVAVEIQAELEMFEPAAGPLRLAVTITAPDGRVTTVEAPIADGRGHLTLPIENPQLWWPNGYGAHPL
ncbi:MAG: hypothetical protein N3D77_16340, partial [Geminicoccaceae bacterium]|nr:hypothetical protein [Geminicoccaceae bacterium]